MSAPQLFDHGLGEPAKDLPQGVGDLLRVGSWLVNRRGSVPAVLLCISIRSIRRHVVLQEIRLLRSLGARPARKKCAA